MNYFIFTNIPKEGFDNSKLDSKSVKENKEYCFPNKENSIDKIKPGDKVIFKELSNNKYWGEAEIQKFNVKKQNEENHIVFFKLKNIIEWEVKVEINELINKIPNSDLISMVICITDKEYEIIKNEINKNEKNELEHQLKLLWINYKESNKKNEFKKIEFENILKEWAIYRSKILDDTLELNDYTNTLSNLSGSSNLPGGYLCNFLERDTRKLFGSSKPGNAFNFGVKLNSDNETYTIGKNNTNVTKNEANVIFNNDINPLLKNIIKESSLNEKIKLVEENDSKIRAKQLLRKLVVLDCSMDFIYIYSDEVIDVLYDKLIGMDEQINLAKNKSILFYLKDILELDDSFVERSLLSGFLWKYGTAQNITDANNPNVILYGPPGTGKTYSIKNNLEFVCKGEKYRYEIIQFHPSYTYEDFIEGIKPKGLTPDGNIKFEIVNGVFKNFCIKAKKDPENDYYFVVDEINRANLSSVFGELMLCLEKDYRHNVKKNSENNSNSVLLKTQYSTLIEELDIEEKEKLSYEIIDGKSYFGVPSNLFFIGMMNDVDKNIDSFDLALRRRFKWIRKDCDYEVVKDETKYKNNEDFNNILEYVDACNKLNKFISKDLGLGISYEFGHSVFMKMSSIAKRKNITESNIKGLFNEHLRPTLKEYLRAVFAEKDLEEKLNDALAKFGSNFIEAK